MRCCFFIARRAIDLAGKKETCNRLGFERCFQSAWIKIVVLDRIPGAQDVYILQARDGADETELYIERKRSRNAIRIELVGRQSFRFEKYLVARLVSKAMNLVFY